MNLFELLGAANESGMVTFVADPARGDEPPTSKDSAREFLADELYGMLLATTYLESVKCAIDNIDLTMSRVAEKVAVTVNLAKLLMLPAVEPAKELKEFRDFLASLTKFFEENPSRLCRIRITNNRDRNRRVHGLLACRMAGETAEDKALEAAATASAMAQVGASPSLSHWLRQYALMLQKLGPWSWSDVFEDQLFEMFEGPHFKHSMKVREQGAAVAAA